MSQGSEIFSTYLSEYTSLSASLSKKLLDLSSAAADQRPYLLSQVEREVEECDEIVHSLEMEIMSLPSTHRSQLQPKVKECKIETDGFKRELTKIKQSNDRDALLGRNDVVVDINGASVDNRARLLQGTERLQDGSKRLDEARRIALETEQIGINTLESLNSQREQISKTHNRLGEADGFVSTSQRILKGMQRRLTQNKILNIGIIIMLIALIILVVAIKWF